MKTIIIAFLCCFQWGLAIASDQLYVGWTGIGPVIIGMSLDDASTSLNDTIRNTGAWDNPDCYYATPKIKLEGVSFMVSKEKIVRIDVDAPIKTTDGFGVGDNEKDVIKKFGARVKIDEHKYGGAADHYLTILSQDGRTALRFETFEGKITRYYLGLPDRVDLTEGCN